MQKVTNYVKRNVVRIYAVVVAALALVGEYVPGLPDNLILGLFAAVLALVAGETVQRVENRKTGQAYVAGKVNGL